MPRWQRITATCALLAAVALTLTAGTQATRAAEPAQNPAAIRYDVRFPAPEHHWLEVTVTFSDLGAAPLRARMSRSSPGRYAVHEFAKNVFQVAATAGSGRPLPVTRPDIDEWRVEGHDGTVHLTYRIFGDRADGTYLGIDTTHAHMNMPATFMWAVGLEMQPMAIAFHPPADSGWTAATQLLPTSDPLAFTAPNLQYFMDSPVELARLVSREFSVPSLEGTTFRVMVHTTATQSEVDALATLVRRVVQEEAAIFGAWPRFDAGTYTFIIDAVPWSDGDAMEHRNSTYISLGGITLDQPAGQRLALDMVAHEFFHAWNVERIRPAGLEPFDFTRENITCCLWLAEGFTEYYGNLTMRRLGLSAHLPFEDVTTVTTSTATSIRSAVEMSEHGPFADAGVANDQHDRSRTFISYYSSGAALALALDLSLRDRSDGRVSLDDFMRRLWTEFGTPDAKPGYVARPYTLTDLRRVLAAVDGDSAFAASFFERYVEGHELPDYARLLDLAGYVFGPAAPGRGSLGQVRVSPEAGGLRVGTSRFDDRTVLVPFDSPAYDAGMDSGDLIVEIDGVPATLERWNALATRVPGTPVALTLERRDGRRVTSTVRLVEDRSTRVMPGENIGRPLTAAQAAFRRAWYAPAAGGN